MASLTNLSTVVIGAGHSGLAMSHCLTERSIDHVVLERGEVASSWRTERWDSLRLLTPNWLSRLPGFPYDGDDPEQYLEVRGVAAVTVDTGRQLAVMLAKKYEGPDAGEEFLQLPPEVIRVVIRITPRRVAGTAAG